MNVTIQYNEQKYRVIPTKGKTHLGVKDQGLGPVSNGVRRSRLKTKCGHSVFSYTSHQTGIPCGICFNEVKYDYTPGARSLEIQAGDYRFHIEELRKSFNTDMAGFEHDPHAEAQVRKIGMEYLERLRHLQRELNVSANSAKALGMDLSNWRKSREGIVEFATELNGRAFDLLD